MNGCQEKRRKNQNLVDFGKLIVEMNDRQVMRIEKNGLNKVERGNVGIAINDLLA